MHQQVRTSTTKRGSGSSGPGAMADEGGLVDILATLLDAEINLRTAGGRDLDRRGQFVFSVHHEGDEDANRKAADLLNEAGYEADVYDVRSCVVSDRPGSLLQCIRETEEQRGPVYEIFVGTPDEDGHIPLQLTTRADVRAESAS